MQVKAAAQGEADAQAGRTVPQDEVFRDLRQRLAEK
jgi:predicted transcriptional regulator